MSRAVPASKVAGIPAGSSSRGLADSCRAIARGTSDRSIASRLLAEARRQARLVRVAVELTTTEQDNVFRQAWPSSGTADSFPSDAIVPLVAGGQTLGSLSVAMDQLSDQDDIGALEVLASSAAQAILSRRLEARLEKAVQERALAEDALRETNHAMQKHQEVGRMGDFRYNTRTLESFGTIECYRMFGQTPSPEEVERAKYPPHVIPLVVDFEAWTTMVVEEDRQRVIDTMRGAVATGAPFKFEYRILVDGDLRHIACDGALYDDHVGDPTYYGVLCDVTDRRRNEESLQAAQQELATAQRLASMGELAASIIHEVSQPITAIRSGAESCRRWLDVPDSEQDLRAALERVLKETVRASSVIGGLRALAKGADTQLATIDVIDAIEEAMTLVRAKAVRDRVAVRTRIEKNPVIVRADRVQLQQVLINLANNAIDAMAAVMGDRILEIATSRPDTEHVAITVSDTGPGIDVDDPERLFDPLYSTKAEGMGLGLAICRRIICAHRGQIHVRANAPRGATFEFQIPLQLPSD